MSVFSVQIMVCRDRVGSPCFKTGYKHAKREATLPDTVSVSRVDENLATLYKRTLGVRARRRISERISAQSDFLSPSTSLPAKFSRKDNSGIGNEISYGPSRVKDSQQIGASRPV